MSNLGKSIKDPNQKIVWVLTLTVILYIAISGIFSIPMNQTTITMSAKAGGLSFYTIGALFLLSVLKAAFLEFVQNTSLRIIGQKIFRFLHKFLGWIIFILGGYHSLFFMYYFIWPVVDISISISIVVTGLCAMLSLVFVLNLGKNVVLKHLNFESVYFKHVFATVVLIILTIIHLNYL